MANTIATILAGISILLYIVGGFALMVVLLYGIYALFAVSIAVGLMMIGAAVVGGWILQIVAGLVSVMAAGLLSAGIQK